MFDGVGLVGGVFPGGDYGQSKRYKACLTKEAEACILDGSALASPIRTTVQKMLNACLTSEEQTPATQQMAQGILSGLLQKASETAK